MAQIEVKKLDDETYDVTVTDRQTTSHHVTVTPAYLAKLAGGDATAEQLLHASFEFLLERESNTMILSSFDLPLIGRYFPEYEREIRGRL